MYFEVLCVFLTLLHQMFLMNRFFILVALFIWVQTSIGFLILKPLIMEKYFWETIKFVTSKGRRNLISLGIFYSNCYSYKFENEILRVCKGSLVILKGFKQNSLYTLLGKTIVNHVHSLQKLFLKSPCYGIEG
ncbi:hypothetical protein M9H77_04996 [Catharanthus roseus]|uniref:Uncharacterized protein n=1 Tax=Catharanthus roseus TaxID=4058 RepID=A0ACC0CFN1_CATRO|nr:hypothetical protein M9H77_04996 [Catharanthus roseus]